MSAISQMSIQELVDRGLAVRRQIMVLTEELKLIEGRLAKAGLDGRQVELKDAEREGRRFLAKGSSCIIPVVFTADKLIGSFKKASAVHKRIAAVAGERLTDFYEFCESYELRFDDGKSFRSAAAELLGERAPELITACLARDKFGIPKSGTSILWDKPEALIKGSSGGG